MHAVAVGFLDGLFALTATAGLFALATAHFPTTID
jgi:hypothetical protein